MTTLLHRQAVAEPNGIDIANGIARLSFSSEHPVLRRNDKRYGTHIEILSHAPGDLNNSILERGAPVLLNHQTSQVIGTVQKGSFQVGPDRRGRATIEVDREWRSYLAAIAKGEAPNQTSVGYSTLSIVRREEGSDGIPILTFSWLPEEISILTEGHEPADPRVGLGRSSRNNMKTIDDLLALALSGSRKIVDDFSDVPLVDAINQVGMPKKGLVREMFESTARIAGNPTQNAIRLSVIAPRTRDLTAGVAPSGGYFVASQMEDGTPLLFNHSVTRRLGATFITGLTENFVKPKATTAPTVTATPEIAAATLSQILTDNAEVKPVRLSTTVTLSRQWLMQAGPSAEAYVRKTIADAINTELDRLALFGQGGNSEPLGLMQTPGVQSCVYGGNPATYAGLLAQEQALAQANIPEDSFGWAISPATRARWKATPKIAATNFPAFLFEDGRVLDYPALASNQLSDSHQSVFGAWRTFLVLVWGDALDMTMDRYTGAAKGECYLTAHLWFNVLPLYPQAFVVSADAANQ